MGAWHGRGRDAELSERAADRPMAEAIDRTLLSNPTGVTRSPVIRA